MHPLPSVDVDWAVVVVVVVVVVTSYGGQDKRVEAIGEVRGGVGGTFRLPAPFILSVARMTMMAVKQKIESGSCLT